MILLGLDARAYILTSGDRSTWGSATEGISSGAAPGSLEAVERVRNVNIPLTKGEADVSTRDNNGWEAVLGTLKKASIEIECIFDPEKENQQMLVSAYMTNSNVALALLGGDKADAGTQGLWADFQVTGMTKGEELEEGQVVTFTVRPALTDVPPEWVEVSGS